MDMGKVKIARRKVRTALRSVRAVCSLPTGRKQGCPRSALHGSSEAILPGGPGGVGVGSKTLRCALSLLLTFQHLWKLMIWFCFYRQWFFSPSFLFASTEPPYWEGAPSAGFWAGIKARWKWKSLPCFVPFVCQQDTGDYLTSLASAKIQLCPLERKTLEWSPSLAYL